MCEAQTPPEGPPEGRRDPEIPKCLHLGDFWRSRPVGGENHARSKNPFSKTGNRNLWRRGLKISEQSLCFDNFFLKSDFFENSYSELVKILGRFGRFARSLWGLDAAVVLAARGIPGLGLEYQSRRVIVLR